MYRLKVMYMLSICTCALVLCMGNARAARADDVGWHLISDAAIGRVSSLSGVVAVASDNIWAVGTVRGRTLTERFDGSSWGVVPSLNAEGSSVSSLASVTSIPGGDDVIAVGHSQNVRSGEARTLIEMWHSYKWALLPGANPGDFSDVLTGISAVASDDIWAVGYYKDSYLSPARALIEHWDGNNWTISDNPKVSKISSLGSVTAIASDNVWAVGQDKGQSLIEHWDGNNWNIVHSPTSAIQASLHGVASVSDSNQVWAAGESQNVNLRNNTLAKKWNGSVWSNIDSPNPSAKSVLSGIAAIGADNVWFVGYNLKDGKPHALIEHWNGDDWNISSSADTGNACNLAAISTVPNPDSGAAQLYAVGACDGRTLVEAYY